MTDCQSGQNPDTMADMKIGATIRRIRKAKAARDGLAKYSQAACGDRAGMSQGQWADLESDRYSPRMETVESAARALGYSLLGLLQAAHQDEAAAT